MLLVGFCLSTALWAQSPKELRKLTEDEIAKIKAAMPDKAVAKPAQAGRLIAAETHKAGADALRERDYRRLGLAVALLTIVVTMAGLWLALRAVEGRAPAAELSRR